MPRTKPFIHQLADVQSFNIGDGTRIWQFVVVKAGAKIGKDSNIYLNSLKENDVFIGDHFTAKGDVQQWLSLSEPAMQEAFFDILLYREIVQLEEFDRLPDENTILRFSYRLEKHKLAEQILLTVNELLPRRGLLHKVGTAVDATLIPAPCAAKNKDKDRDPAMHSSKKRNQWCFGMVAHIAADAASGLVHTVRGSSVQMSDIRKRSTLLHGKEKIDFVDAAYQGIERRPEAKHDVNSQIAMRPGKRKALDKENAAEALIDKVEKIKAGIRAKVEHTPQIIKHQFGFIKVRYKEIKKKTQLITLFALSNLWMVRTKLIGVGA